MARESVMSTPIFDQLLREMAQRAESHVAPPNTPPTPTPPASPTLPPAPDQATTQDPEQPRPAAPRRRHRAD